MSVTRRKQSAGESATARESAKARQSATARRAVRVGILMGSETDRPTVEAAAAVLRDLRVGHELLVRSAHRTPDDVRKYVRSAERRGLRVLIAAAGGAAHLAGAVAAHTTLPVLGVPLASTPLAGLDALLATVQMPAGVPVGTLAIGAPGARNAAYLAAQILALGDAALAERLRAHRRGLRDRLLGGRGGGGRGR